ncbi:MAG TPA: serine/threonine protein kinase, partial [Planctomycetaceae bacterium]|nr:serine/threonine protein kinase [Planctomycetaceae bacterium]
GQTSRIWQAYHDVEQKLCGVKVLLDDFRRNREHLAYLKQEWIVGGKLEHPRIIRMLDFATQKGEPYLAMEWFSAPNLKQRLRYDYQQFEYLFPNLIEQMCEALIHLHDHGWVHRDVKPDNFLVSDSGEVKLIDFALAQRAKAGLSRLLGSKGKIQGTKSYMSPEQIRGAALDGRADLYSLGCTVFEMVGGRTPFTGVNATELLTKHLRSSPPTIESLNRNITPEFGDLVRRCLAKTPSARPASVADFLNEMRMLRIFRTAPKPPSELPKSAESAEIDDSGEVA